MFILNRIDKKKLEFFEGWLIRPILRFLDGTKNGFSMVLILMSFNFNSHTNYTSFYKQTFFLFLLFFEALFSN